MRLRDSFSILRSSVVSDGIGGYSETLVIARSDIKCYVRQLSNDEMETFAMKGRTNVYRVHCSDINDMTISDTLSILRYGDTLPVIHEIEGIRELRRLGTGHKKGLELDTYIQD